MSFRTTRLVEFHHTDQAGICHFSSFFLMMESVEHEFLRSLGTSVVSEHRGRKVSFPRLAASCEYLSPARFEDRLQIALEVVRLGTKSVTYSFVFTLGETPVARGKITTVCCFSDPGAPLRSIAIPADIAAKIESARKVPNAQAD